MKSLFFTVTLSIFLFTSLGAANYYFLLDPSCMDRLEYEIAGNGNVAREVWYSYQVGNKKVLLEVGVNPSQRISQLDGTVYNCSNRPTSNYQLNQLRSQGNRLFLVRALSTPDRGYSSNYEAYELLSAGVLEADAYNLNLYHWQYSFQYRIGSSPQGQPLPGGSGSGRIVYQRSEPNSCLTTYVFRQYFNFDQNAYIDIKVIPQIGIVGEYPNSAGTFPKNLVSVNGNSLFSVINQLCSSASSGSQTRGGQNGAFGPSPPPSTVPVSPSPAPTTPGNTGSTQKHRVSRGETLWAIAKKYNIEISDLKAWNNLSSNTISTNQELIVSPNTGRPSPAARTRGGSSSLMAPPPSSNTVGSSPFPEYPTGASRDPVWAQPPPVPQNIGAASRNDWRTTDGYHTVQPGETVGALARQYGYTEARFRYMNNLGPDDIVRPNQVLKTLDQPRSAAPYGITPSTPYGSRGNESTVTPYQAPGTNNYDLNQLYSQADPNQYPFEPYQSENSPSFGGQPPASGSGFNPTTSYDWTEPSPAAPPSYDLSPPPAYPSYPAQTGPGATIPPSYDSPASSYQPGGGSADQPAQTYNPGGAAGGGGGQPPASQPGNANLPTQNTLPTFNQNTRGGSNPTFNYNPGGTPPPAATGMPSSYSQPSTRGGSANTPFGSSIGTTTVTPNNSDPEEIVSYHVVQPGETLQTISSRYGVSVSKLRSLNNLEKDDQLNPYQRLYIQ